MATRRKEMGNPASLWQITTTVTTKYATNCGRVIGIRTHSQFPLNSQMLRDDNSRSLIQYQVVLPLINAVTTFPLPEVPSGPPEWHRIWLKRLHAAVPICVTDHGVPLITPLL